MTRTQRLQPLLKIAERKQQDTAIGVAKARKRLHHYEQKLHQLISFRDDYHNRLQELSAQQQQASSLNEFYRFMRQLDAGIAGLKRQILQQQQQNRLDESSWREAKRKVDSLDRLINVLKLQESNYLLELEQNELDEHSSHRNLAM